MEIGAIESSRTAFGGTERLKEGFKNKEGIDEIMDREMGPDVRYVLSRDDIDLVKRYLAGPITPAEFRELTFKLRQLQAQELGVDEVAEKGDISKEGQEGEIEFRKTGEANLTLEPQRTLIDFTV
jgi:hypothetical protein